MYLCLEGNRGFRNVVAQSVEEREGSRLKRTGEQKRLPVLDVKGAVKSVAEVLTQEEVERYAEQRKEEEQALEGEKREWRMEIYKMLSSLAINIFVIVLLVVATLVTTAEISSRFMSLLEIVIGAIFGVTATQVAKD
jgi:hypothetical protein